MTRRILPFLFAILIPAAYAQTTIQGATILVGGSGGGGGNISGTLQTGHLVLGTGLQTVGPSIATDTGTLFTYPGTAGILSPIITFGNVSSGNYGILSLTDDIGAYTSLRLFSSTAAGTTLDATGLYTNNVTASNGLIAGTGLFSGTVTLGLLQNGTPGQPIEIIQNGGNPLTLNVQGGLEVTGAIDLSNGYGTAGYVIQSQGAGLPAQWVANSGGGGGATLGPNTFTGNQTAPNFTDTALTSGQCVAAGTGGILVGVSCDAGASLNVKSYGAACVTGTDDSAAYQSAFNASAALYNSTGAINSVQICPQGQLGTGSGQTTLNVGGGTRIIGPGSITVPAQSANPLFLMTSTDNDTFDNFTVTFTSNLTACGAGMNNAACAAIRYDSANPGTATTHRNVRVQNVTLVNSGWGILLRPESGTDLLSNVYVHHNWIGQTATCNSSGSYQYADAIHLGGSISNFEVDDNIINCRGDAGIATSSELLSGSTLLCHDGTITGNVVYEGRIGVDNSGCNNLVITGNRVYADISVGTSNPAFRSIYYSKNLPIGVQVTGNWFHNYQSAPGVPDNSAKFDCTGGCGAGGYTTVNPSYSVFEDNHVDTLYLKGSALTVSENTFANNGVLTLDVDTANTNGSYNDIIGANNWLGTGTINLNSNPNYYTGGVFSSQVGNGNVSFPNKASISDPQTVNAYEMVIAQSGSLGFSSTNPSSPATGDSWINRAGPGHLYTSTTQGGSVAREFDTTTLVATNLMGTYLNVASGGFYNAQGTATSLGNFGSACSQYQNSVWNGTAAQLDYYNVCGTSPSGTNPNTGLSFTHGGGLGGGSYNFDNTITVAGPGNGVFGLGTTVVTPGSSTIIGTGGTPGYSAPVCATGVVCDSLSGTYTFTTGAGISAAGVIFTVTVPGTRANYPSCSGNLKGGTSAWGEWITSTNSLGTVTLSYGSNVQLANNTAYTFIMGACGGQ